MLLLIPAMSVAAGVLKLAGKRAIGSARIEAEFTVIIWRSSRTSNVRANVLDFLRCRRIFERNRFVNRRFMIGSIASLAGLVEWASERLREIRSKSPRQGYTALCYGLRGR